MGLDKWGSINGVTWMKMINQTARKAILRATQTLSDDRGNVESALTLIPLMILFLTVSQVGISVYSKDTYSQMTQGAVAYDAMGLGQSQLSLNSSTSGTYTWSSPPIALPLPGGGSVLVGQRQIHRSAVTPLLLGGETFTTTGVAVQE